jgi:hypothetical protein
LFQQSHRMRLVNGPLLCCSQSWPNYSPATLHQHLHNEHSFASPFDVPLPVLHHELSLYPCPHCDKTFGYLARQYADGKAGHPTTLWCDLFVLTQMYQDRPGITRLLSQPCYLENKQGNDTEDNQLHLAIFSPKCMTSLEIVAPAFEENDFIPYTILPVYMYSHSPHLLRTDESVCTLFYS